MEPEGAVPEGEEGVESRVIIYKLTVRVLRFVAKLDDGSERQVAEHDMEFEVNMKHFTVEKMVELIRSKIAWGSGQEVHILCQDKHFESVERIDNYWKLLTAFLERWEEKELLVVAQVVDIAKGVITSSCSENIPSSEIVDNIICSSSDVYQSNASSATCVDDSTTGNLLLSNARYMQSDGEVIDWSAIAITPIGDDVIYPISHEDMCVVLGIEDEAEDAQPLNEPAPVVVCHVSDELMAEGAIPVDDQVPEDIEMSYDKDYPKVEKGSIFPTMIDCRRAVRQWAINEEFNNDRKRKLRLKSCLEKGGGNYKKKPPPKGQLGSQNRCKKCKQLGHRQASCPTNGVKKRNPKSRKIKPNTEVDVECTIPGDVLQASPRPVTRSQSSFSSPLGGVSPLAVPQTSPRPRTRSQSSLGSPLGGMSPLAVPQANPRPMTRSQSSLGGPLGGMSLLAVPHASPRPMTRSQSSLGSPLGETSSLAVLQGSPGPITRRQLSMEEGTPTSPPKVVVRPAKKLTPKRRKRV